MPSPRPAHTPIEERLSYQLKTIAVRCEKESVTVGEVLSTLPGNPYLLLTALLSLPFIPPLPLFWLAPLSGILIAIFGLHMALGLKPTLPKNLLDLKIPHKIFPTILKATSRMLRWVEFVSRPRWLILTSSSILMNFYGILIFVAAIFLCPPLPIPFWHLMPALTLFLLSLGLVERDGVFIVLGGLSFTGMLLVVYGIIFYGHKIFEKIGH